MRSIPVMCADVSVWDEKTRKGAEGERDEGEKMAIHLDGRWLAMSGKMELPSHHLMLTA